LTPVTEFRQGEKTTKPRVLVAGIGNIFLGDDAFGSEVVRRLTPRASPDGVRIVDFGIRGFDLVYALLEEYDVTILVDATPRGDEPGTLYVIEPDLNELDNLSSQELMVEPHGMNPLKVLGMARALGGQFKRVLLVGCEPATFGPEEGQIGLSAPVEAAVNEAIKVVEKLVSNVLSETVSAAIYE
jgi:hydrogenase maturation protease